MSLCGVVLPEVAVLKPKSEYQYVCTAETLSRAVGLMQMHPSWMAQLVHESQRCCTHERHGLLHHNIQELHGLNILPSDVMSTLEHFFFGPQVMLRLASCNVSSSLWLSCSMS